MLRPDYNRIANYYDLLAKLVFGNKLIIAQNFFLNQLGNPSDILIFGGGTGCMIPPLLEHCPNARIRYLEASSAMIKRAKARTFLKHAQVDFSRGTELLLADEREVYDVIITPFVLDVFNDKSMKSVFELLLGTLKQGGQWIQTDFYQDQNSPHWQRTLVRLMYLFFKVTTGQQNQKLPDFEVYFHHPQLRLLDKRSFVHNMVSTELYEKC